MAKHRFLDAETASEKIVEKTCPPGLSRPDDRDANAALYGRGRRIADRLARHGAQRADTMASLRQVAVDMGLDAKEARSAFRFMEAVDIIAENLGPAAKELILGGIHHVTPERVVEISRAPRERQQFAMAQIARGRPPRAEFIEGTAPPLDALGFRDYCERFSRSARALDGLSDALADAGAGGRPTPAESRAMGLDLAAIIESGAALQETLGQGTLVPPAPLSLRCSDSRPPWHPKPFDPGRDLAYVAGVRGLLAYSVRHLTRLLAEAPAAGRELRALRDGLQGLDSAVQRLSETLRPHARTATSRSTGGRRRGARTGPSSESMADVVRVIHAPGGPEVGHGTYAILYTLGRPATVTVKSRLSYVLPAGHLIYIGSAFGSGGVRTRVSWHLDPTKYPQKNVDFLKPVARPVGVWWTHDEVRRECPWSAVLASSPEYHCPAPKFGATDCRICPAHLYHTPEPPDVHDFALRLGRLVPDHGSVFHHCPGWSDT